VTTKLCRVAVFAFGASLILAGCGTSPDDTGTSTVFREAKALVASDAQDEDEFGGRVAIDGDSVAVGASGEDGAGTARGAVYLFSRNQGGTDAWGEIKKITASAAQDLDQFGYSVDLAGDILAVGTVRGAVYVYYRDQGGADNWGEVTKIAGSAAQAGFGRALALTGDRLIVGAPDEAGGGNGRGAAYVFYRDQGGSDAWGQVAWLTAADAHDYQSFGSSVAVSGEEAVVGAIGMDPDDTGAAYVFSQNLGGADAWGQAAKITASDAQPQDQFGWPVVILGDTIVIGAACEDGQAGIGDNPGAAYVYSRNLGGANAWGELRKLTNSAGEGAFFGVSADLSGDFLVIGALYSGGTGVNRDFGAAYFFSRNEGGPNFWGLLNTATAGDGEDFDFLGMSASFSGDYAVVGAPGKDGGGPDRGKAYIFRKSVQKI
jgi:hypothetical protein